MYKRFLLKDFKSHKESILDLHPGLNAIIGLPDKGKSNLLKGLNWVFTNRAPSDFIRWDTGTKGARGADISGTASAEILIERGSKEIKVTRTRGQEINEYTCGDEKFGTVNKEVPQQVLDALNLTSINIQEQFEGHYLLFETGGLVASTFNKLTNLDKVDEVVSLLSSDLTKAKQRMAYAKEELEKKQEELQHFTYLEQLEDDVVIYEDVASEITSLTADKGSITQAVTSSKESTEGITRIDLDLDIYKVSLSKLKDSLAKLEVAQAQLTKEGDEVTKLSSNLEDLLDAQDRLDVIGKEAPVLTKRLDLTNNQFSLVSDIETKSAEFIRLEDCTTQYSVHDKDIKIIDVDILSIKDELVEHVKEFEDVDTCVLCEQPLTKKAKEIMLGNL